MSNAQRLVGSVGLALAIGFGTAWQFASAQVEKPTAVKWEYRTTHGPESLSEAPKDGWELGWVTANSSGVSYTWKRAK